jgi:ferredoxin
VLATGDRAGGMTMSSMPPLARPVAAPVRLPLTLAIDWIRCDGFGMCAELLPELVELDDWGYPIIRAGAVPDDLLDHARRAVDACPVLALRLRAAATPVTPASGRG